MARAGATRGIDVGQPLQEIESGAANDGLHFCDFRAYHELNRERRHP